MNSFNQKGYALLFTLMALLLISVIGISLITLSLNGTTRNENRENSILATDLSEKGTTYLTNQISSKLEAQKLNLKNSLTTVDTIFDTIHSEYKCTPNATNNVVITGSTGKSDVCIEAIETKEQATAHGRRNTRLVTLRSIGEADGSKIANTTSIIEMGYSDIPEQLSYAISTNDNGNLYFFGGSEVTGNIKVSGDMYVSPKSYWASVTNAIWEESVPLTIKSDDLNKKSTIYTNKNTILSFKDSIVNLQNLNDASKNESIYSLNNNGIKQFNNYVTEVPINSIGSLVTGGAPLVRPFTGDSNPIKISNSQNEDPLNKSKFGEMLDGYAKGNVTAHNTFNRKNDLALESGTLLKDKAYYVNNGANMILGNSNNANNDSSTYKNLNLKGNYYVDGDLTIQSVNLKADAIIYVKGDVKLSYSTVEPLKSGGNEGTLFIFADGNISINNISVGSIPGKGSNINGYFYSNKDITMYGVGTNIKITGGMSGRNIIYTALRGNAQGNGIKKSYTIPATCDDVNCLSILNKPSAITFTNAEKALIMDWSNRLKYKVAQSWGSYYLVNSFDLGNGKTLTREEIDLLDEFIVNPNQHKNVGKVISNLAGLGNVISNSTSTFNYTNSNGAGIYLANYSENDRRTIATILKKYYNYASQIYSSTDSKENQLAQASRLQIVYDKELVDRFRNRSEDDASAVQDLKVYEPKVHAMTVK